MTLLEARGLLHARRSRDGFVRLDPVEVDELAKTWRPTVGRPRKDTFTPRAPGSLEARIVELLDEKRTPREIVRLLRVPFDVVRRVHREYKRDFDPDGVYESPEERNERLRIELERERLAVRLELAALSHQRAVLDPSKRTRKRNGRKDDDP